MDIDRRGFTKLLLDRLNEWDDKIAKQLLLVVTAHNDRSVAGSQ